MKKIFKKFWKQMTCSHSYEYVSSYNIKKLSRSENPFWYTTCWIRLKCEKCDKKIKETYEWCKENNLPTHKPIGRPNRRPMERPKNPPKVLKSRTGKDKTSSISEEEMKEVAKELGLEITFNSDNPGVINTTTGEHKNLEDFFPELKMLDEEDNSNSKGEETMIDLLKEKRTKEELRTHLLDKSDGYLLENYAQAKISFEEDVRNGRYSEHAENVREALKECILNRMGGAKS